jgi:hypothetical protein
LAFFAWIENTSLAMWIGLSDSFFAYPLILLLHTIGLTLIVGVNLVVALRVLGVCPEMPLDELEQLFPLMWVGLFMNVLTGVLLFIAKATQFIVNPAFYLKMISIVAALSIFVVMRKHTNSRSLALASIAFWLLAIIGGRAMAYVGEAAQFSSLWI